MKKVIREGGKLVGKVFSILRSKFIRNFKELLFFQEDRGLQAKV